MNLEQKICFIYSIGWFIALCCSVSYYEYHLKLSTGKVSSADSSMHWIGFPIMWPLFVLYFIITIPRRIAFFWHNLPE